jgi:hypothetical protein
LVYVGSVRAEKSRLEHGFRAAESLDPDSNDVAIWQLVGRQLIFLGCFLVEVQRLAAQLLLDVLQPYARHESKA